MNAAYERALILHDQHRYADAERELKQVLTDDPRNAHAHAMLAMCLAEQRRFREATAEAEQAVGLEPFLPFAHYVHAKVLADRNRGKEARTAIQEALRLNSSDPNYYAMLARIELDERKWQSAVDAAENGLAIHADHTGCLNLRAMALVQLGRKAEAASTIDGALSRNPHSAVTHANQGWAMLHLGQYKQALIHFREALRLNPELDWARQGMVEALKARNPIYRVMLKYFLFMSRLDRRVQWGIVIGGYLGYRVLVQVAQTNPQVAPFVWPALIAYIVFAYMSWIASPLFNLMLRFSRYGKYMLSRDQRVGANWVGVLLLAALVCLVLALTTNIPATLLAAVCLVGMVPAVSTVFRCPEGWPRLLMAGYALALLAIAAGIVGSFAVALRTGQRPELGETLGPVFVVGVILSGVAANALIGMKMRR
jgi:tetratricopeptide (TPR) repeat protein